MRRPENRRTLVGFSLSGGLSITLCCSGWGCHSTSKSRNSTQVGHSNLAIPAKSPNQEAALRNGWKRIEVEGAVKLDIPQDMRTTAPVGDSDAYQESYRNATVRLDIAYGDFDACKTDEESIKNGTYTESFLEINGKKAKLGIDREYEPRFTIGTLCFPHLAGSTHQLHILAMCNGKEAFSVAEKIFASVEIK